MELNVNLKDCSYPIYFERGGLDHIQDYFDINRKIAIITDSGVPLKWVETLQKQIPDSFVITFKQGENSKNILTWTKILEQMADHGMNRKDAVIALGGGVCGDMAGFAAASYMRGIDFYNIPTTVLSQVDSSVGGKVAVDLDGHKNMVGAFWQPKAVLIDSNVLSTLNDRQISNGLVEALKMGLILDEKLVEEFEKDSLDLDAIIFRSIDLKREIVEQDEREGSLRKILNFGHTIGHAIETSYGLDEYLHGECVAMGMPFFIQDEKTKERIKPIYKKLNLPKLPEYDPEKVMEALKFDKKGTAKGVSCVFIDTPEAWSLKDLTFEEIENKLRERT